MRDRSSASLLICLVVASLALLCSAAEKSEELSPSNFKKKVLDSNDIWAVLFYAPWCGHCKALFPDWAKLAGAIAPSIKVGQVNADEHKELGGQYQVQGFPTIKFFGANKKKPVDYQGQRTAAAIAQHALKMLSDQVAEKLGGKPSSSSGGSKSGGGGGGGKDAAIQLTEADFESKVLNSNEDWLVEFMAPWCGHCQRLKPEWEDAARQLKGEFKLGVVDATQETGLASTYGVKGYPTIKLFKTGPKGNKEAVDYNGGRTASDIVQFVSNHIESTGAAKPLPEITSSKVFESECSSEWHGICVIAFLPHILDDQAAGRNLRLEKLAQARKKSGRTFKFMWVVGGENYELEEKLGLGFGYPAVVAVSPSKKRFAVMRGTYDANNIDDFLSAVLRGKQTTSDVKPWPMKFVKLDAWDGKDAAPPEEVDLDDE
mmetsp:Transcript_48268/g.114409  ORF Transcript_48268/g.114409 Transcript_48268/m.114409 type:complete len:430 (+) Transcript_48268:3-1292(+)